VRHLTNWDEQVQAFDFETSGTLPEYALQPWRRRTNNFWATSLVWARKIDGKIKDFGGLAPDRGMMREMLEEAVLHKRRMLGWNVVFDIAVLLSYDLDDLVFQLDWLDGMLLWRHAFIEPEYETERHKKRSYGLKPAVAELFPQWANYAEDVDFHDPSPEARAKLHRYNIRDVGFTYFAAQYFWNQLNDKQQRVALIEADCLPMVAKANLEGLLIDTLAARELSAKLAKTAADRLSELSEHGVTEAVVRSPTQLAKLLFDQWGLPVQKENVGKKTGKVSRATDKEVLHELSFLDPRAKKLREFREALNNRTKFAEAPLESVEYCGDGRTHPQAMVFSTYTSRLTYSSKQGKNKDERPIGFALHQEKRGKDFRKIIIAPDGYDLLEFDAAGQEFRWMAIMSGDETMLTLCEPGEDPHGFMASQLYNMDYRTLVALVKAEDTAADKMRKHGKLTNLSCQYRTSANKIRIKSRIEYDFPMTEQEALHTHRTYQRSYKRVPDYWMLQIAKTKRLGYVENIAGRRVEVKGNWRGPQGWSMESTSINYPIQSIGGDQKYLAMSVIRPYLTQVDGQFLFDLHDGLYMIVPKHRSQKASIEIKHLLDNLPYTKAWGFSPPVPLPWDRKIGPSWALLKEPKE
jgi:DNA polymerase I-like protein with 3'-5' exonuclease and polymerase domains